MKSSKNQLENAVLFYAKIFGQEENYKALMSEYKGFPRIVEMIVYEMFLHKFNSYHCTDEQYEQYKILLEYATELKQNGFVTLEDVKTNCLNHVWTLDGVNESKSLMFHKCIYCGKRVSLPHPKPF